MHMKLKGQSQVSNPRRRLPPSTCTAVPNPMDSPTDPNPTTAPSTSTSTSTSTSSRVPKGLGLGLGSGSGSGLGWNALTDDLILSILPRISALDLIAGANSVCSSWRAAARDPICWQILDLSDWDAVTTRFGPHISFTHLLHRILAFSRASAHIHKFYFPPSADAQDLIFAADRLPNLKYLSLPNPHIQEDDFFIALPKFQSLTGLAIDQYFGQSVNILSLLQKHCPYLTEFKLFGQEDRLEHHHAMIICYFLPNLTKLDIPIRLSRRAILAFLQELHGLEYLDISGYQDSVINNEILEKASRLKVFIWHSGRELGEFVVCSNCGGNESDTMPCQCALGQKMMEWLADP